MSCNLTQGFPIECRSEAGSGIKAIHLVEFSDADTYTKASGEITAHTLDGARVYFKWALPKNLSNMQWLPEISPENGTVVYNAEVTAKTHGMSTAMRNELKLMAKTRMRVIVEDGSGVYWMLGADTGVDMIEAPTDFGTENGSFKGTTIKLKHSEGDYPAKVQTAVVTSLGLND